MKEFKYFCKEHKSQIIIISSISLILIISIISFILINNKYNAEETNEELKVLEKEENIEETNEIIPEEEKTIKVDVKGYVVNPGVYELKENSRVIDAINASGGFTEGAYTRYINLSKILKDENVIIVTNKEEVEELKKSEEKEVIVCENICDVCITDEVISNEIGTTTNKEENQNNQTNTVNTLVNINTASLEELKTLNGIGESTAKKIINYRETVGLFKNIEDIKNVSGIGETTYAKIKEDITV